MLATSIDHRAISAWLLLATWVGIVVALAVNDAFLVDDNVPPWPIIAAVALPVGAFALVWRDPATRSWLLGIDERLVLALQLWRVAGIAFLFGYAADDLDGTFAIPAGAGDVATGIAALLLLHQLLHATPARRQVVWFTVLGVGDFTVALAAGALVRPDGLELLPWILFPTLAVPFFSIVHFLNWQQLSNANTRDCQTSGPALLPRIRH